MSTDDGNPRMASIPSPPSDPAGASNSAFLENPESGLSHQPPDQEDIAEESVKRLIEHLENNDESAFNDTSSDASVKLNALLLGMEPERLIKPMNIAARRVLHDAVYKILKAIAYYPVQPSDGSEPIQNVDPLSRDKIDPQATGDDGWSAFHFASRKGYDQVVKILLDSDTYSVVLNTKDKLQQLTPLGKAIQNGHWKTAEVLLSTSAARGGAEVEVEAWMVASAAKNDEATLLKALLGQPGSNLQELLESRDAIGDETPLLATAERGKWEILLILINHGADRNAADKKGETVLMKACHRDRTDMVWEVLEPGKGHTAPLARSKSQIQGKSETAVPLNTQNQSQGQDQGQGNRQTTVSLNAQDEKGETVLHKVCRLGRLPFFERLLEYTFNNDPIQTWINIRNRDGMTPLHITCSTNRQDIESLSAEDPAAAALVSSSPNNVNSTSYVQWSRANPDDVTTTSPKQQSKKTTPKPQRGKLIRALLKARANPFIEDSKERTAFHMALHNDNKHLTLSWLLNETKNHYFSGEATEAQAIRMIWAKTVNWATKMEERHGIVKAFLSYDRAWAPNGGGSLPSDSNTWNAAEWAAYRGTPGILFTLLAVSQESGTHRGLKSAIKIAKEAWQKESKAKSTPSPPQPGDSAQKSGGGGHNRSSSQGVATIGSGYIDRQLVQDLLRDPPFTIFSRPKRHLVAPTPSVDTKNSQATLSGWIASIIHFYYSSNGEPSFLRRDRSVWEVIYGEGPKKPIADAKVDLENLFKRVGQKTDEYPLQETAAFRWVHLPANNMTWMNHLLQRLMNDELMDEQLNEKNPNQHSGGLYERKQTEFQNLSSFLANTWSQIPDRASRFRIMRPRFVKSNDRGFLTSHLGQETQTSSGSITPPPNDKPSMNDAETSQTIEAVYMPYLAFSEYHMKMKHLTRNDERRWGLQAVDQQHQESTSRSSDSTAQDKRERNMPEKWRHIRKRAEMHKALRRAYPDDAMHRCSTLDESYYHFQQKNEEAEKDRRYRNESQIITKAFMERRRRLEKKRASEEEHTVGPASHWRNIKDRIDAGLTQSAGSKNEGVDAAEEENEGLENPYWPILRVNQLWVWAIGKKWLITSTTDSLDDSESTFISSFLDHLNKQASAGGMDSQPHTTVDIGRALVDYCIGAYDRTTDSDPRRSIRQIYSQSVNDIATKETSLYRKVIKHINYKQEADQKGRNTPKPADASDKVESLIQDATDLSYQVRDVRDELNILVRVAKYQSEVQNEQRQGDSAQAYKSAGYIVKDMDEMDKVANRLQSSLDTTLDLLQSRVSINQARETVRQGRILMAFTLITILFLPLSFLATYFALDYSDFAKTPTRIHVIIFFVSITFSASFSFAAFKWDRMDGNTQMVIRNGVHGVREAVRNLGHKIKPESTPSMSEQNFTSRVEGRYDEFGP